jgi:hypothetical protein
VRGVGEKTVYQRRLYGGYRDVCGPYLRASGEGDGIG